MENDKKVYTFSVYFSLEAVIDAESEEQALALAIKQYALKDASFEITVIDTEDDE